jgi:hypothetical protein
MHALQRRECESGGAGEVKRKRKEATGTHPLSYSGGDEELGPVCVLTGVGHTEEARAGVAMDEVLVCQAKASLTHDEGWRGGTDAPANFSP